jgi:hypothetical protein
MVLELNDIHVRMGGQTGVRPPQVHRAWLTSFVLSRLLSGGKRWQSCAVDSYNTGADRH